MFIVIQQIIASRELVRRSAECNDKWSMSPRSEGRFRFSSNVNSGKSKCLEIIVHCERKHAQFVLVEDDTWP
jgi:hypothetical protein